MKFKRFMGRLGAFLWSFINPKRMEVHRDMNLFIVVLVFLMCGMLCAGVPSLRLTKVVKDKYLNECYVYEDAYQAELVDFDARTLPKFVLNSSNAASQATVEGYQEYDLVYKSADNELPINLKIVYELDKDRDDELSFDLNAYLSDAPFDANKNLKSRDILVVYTDQILYYIYNHGYNDAYAKTGEDASIEDYHYLYVKSWASSNKWSLYDCYEADGGVLTPYLYFPAEDETDLDSTKWTVKMVAEYDNDGNLINSEKTIDGKTYKGVFHYTKKINKIFTYEEKLNVGVYSYLELEGNDTTYRNLANPLQTYADMMVTSSVTSVRVYSYILAAFYVVVLPIMWVLVMWLILHKNGELQRLREYYAVGAAAMVLPSIATAIVGLWIPYTIISRIAMIVQAVWYFVVCTIINTSKRRKKDEATTELIDVKTVEVEDQQEIPETAKLSDYEENDEPKVHHSRVE